LGASTNDVRFVYDGWNLLAELNAQSSKLRTYLWGLDLSGSAQGAGGVGGLLAVSDQSTINNQPSSHFAVFDGNGNVAGLVNAADGSISADYEYGPFGEVIRSTGPMAKANPFRFSTKYQDDESDLLYYGYRYYNASTGRWLNRDPLQEKGGLNLYANVGNNPINSVDPDGRGVVDCIAAMAELNAAMANLAARIAGAEVYGLDAGHKKALEQATTRCQNALDRVMKHCGCVVGAALIATEATVLIEAAIALIEAAPVVIIAL
jgi:RHS repeat-associated protein